MILDVEGLLPTSFRTSIDDPSHVTGATWQTLEGHGGAVTSVAFSRDSKLLINGNRIKVDRTEFLTRDQHPEESKDERYYQELSIKGSWVTLNTQRLLWLPSDYRAFRFNISPSNLIIGVGCGSGKGYIIEFSLATLLENFG
ncbi:hypothetical protein G7Y89_g10343 [Cudoniella acicularis]|uniref:Uncharacterized protein n=1 Tax=Cudoniella acicularis TaxID=354080 RepID=A0A8H4VYV1_9HELO|nr:hypothetical protein G7Y89_g10343 [Cudoniella acicularis]